MIYLILFVIGCLFYVLKYKYHVRINFKSFLKKGFVKTDDKFGLYVMISPQGGGKTYTCVDLILHGFSDKKVISNVKSFCDRVKGSIYMNDFNMVVNFLSQMDDCSGYVIFYDELFTILGRGELTKKSREFLTQFRKRGLYCFTTCQLWNKIPKDFRDLTRYQVSTHMKNLPLFHRAYIVIEINDGGSVHWSDADQDFVCDRIETIIKKCELTVAQCYDTKETISSATSITA